MVNSNMVNSKFHLIQSHYEIFSCHFPNIPCLKCTVNLNFHLIRSKTLPTNDFELTVPDLYALRWCSVENDIWTRMHSSRMRTGRTVTVFQKLEEPPRKFGADTPQKFGADTPPNLEQIHPPKNLEQTPPQKFGADPPRKFGADPPL